MATLTVENLVPTARIAVAPDESLLAAAQAAGHDWAHACGGRGRCTTCRVQVLAGAEWLAPRTAAEERFAALGRLPAGSRLCCQTRLAPHVPPDAELRGTVPPEGRLPHLVYTVIA